MAEQKPPVCDFGWNAIDFSLPGVDTKTWTLSDVRGPNGVLVMFICNHCPYVKAAIDRIVRDCNELAAMGVGAIAIMSNDTVTYPEDAFDRMKAFAAAGNMTFPYVIDESQQVAKAYGAVCTPDFFGFNGDMALQYRGRLDALGPKQTVPGIRRELFEAMAQVAKTGEGPAEQVASIGCSLKWRDAA
jgi:peroxiredoxin